MTDTERSEHGVPVAVVGMVPTVAKVVSLCLNYFLTLLELFLPPSGSLLLDALRLPAARLRHSDHDQVLPGQDGYPRHVLLPPHSCREAGPDKAGTGKGRGHSIFYCSMDSSTQGGRKVRSGCRGCLEIPGSNGPFKAVLRMVME